MRLKDSSPSQDAVALLESQRDPVHLASGSMRDEVVQSRVVSLTIDTDSFFSSVD